MSLTRRKSDFTVSLGRLRFCLSPSKEGWSLISTLEPSKMQVSPMSSDCGILCGKSRKARPEFWLMLMLLVDSCGHA